jgi:hypothetical protein
MAFHSLKIISALIAASVFAGQAAHAQNWAATVSAARKEGKVVVYNGSTPVILNLVAQPFEKRFGVSVERLDARPAEVRERIRSEQAAGRFIGDVTITIVETLKSQLPSVLGFEVEDVRAGEDGVACITYHVANDNGGQTQSHAVVHGDKVYREYRGNSRFEKAWNSKCASK